MAQRRAAESDAAIYRRRNLALGVEELAVQDVERRALPEDRPAEFRRRPLRRGRFETSQPSTVRKNGARFFECCGPCPLPFPTTAITVTGIGIGARAGQIGMWFRSGSIASARKSIRSFKTTGRIPASASPIAAPCMRFSEFGIVSTRTA